MLDVILKDMRCFSHRERNHPVVTLQLTCEEGRHLLFRRRRELLRDGVCDIPTPGNIRVKKRLKLRLSGSARKSQKRFQGTLRFKFLAVFVRIEPFQRSNGPPRPGRPSSLNLTGCCATFERSRYIKSRQVRTGSTDPSGCKVPK